MYSLACGVARTLSTPVILQWRLAYSKRSTDWASSYNEENSRTLDAFMNDGWLRDTYFVRQCWIHIQNITNAVFRDHSMAPTKFLDPFPVISHVLSARRYIRSLTRSICSEEVGNRWKRYSPGPSLRDTMLVICASESCLLFATCWNKNNRNCTESAKAASLTILSIREVSSNARSVSAMVSIKQVKKLSTDGAPLFCSSFSYKIAKRWNPS